MNALRRIVRAPDLVALVLVAGLAPGLLARQVATMSARAAMGPFDVLRDGHDLAYLVELLAAHPSVGLAIAGPAAAGGLLAALAMLVLTGGLVARLEGRGGFGGAVTGALAPVLVQSLYHAVLRVVFLGLVFLAAGPAPAWISAASLAVAYGLCVHAFDVTRVRACRAADRYHPRLAFRAFMDVLSRRGLFSAGAVALVLLGGAAALAGAFAGLSGDGSAASTAAVRMLAGTGMFLGLWRLSVAVEREQPLR